MQAFLNATWLQAVAVLDLFLILTIYWGTQGTKNQQKERLDKAPDIPTGKCLKHL